MIHETKPPLRQPVGGISFLHLTPDCYSDQTKKEVHDLKQLVDFLADALKIEI